VSGRRTSPNNAGRFPWRPVSGHWAHRAYHFPFSLVLFPGAKAPWHQAAHAHGVTQHLLTTLGLLVWHAFCPPMVHARGDIMLLCDVETCGSMRRHQWLMREKGGELSIRRGEPDSQITCPLELQSPPCSLPRRAVARP